MKPGPGPIVGWPGWAHLRFAWGWTLAVTIWFAVVYGGANAWTARREWRVRVHFDFELALPLIPWLAVVYMSVYLLFLGAPFVLRNRGEVMELVRAEALAILAAGLCFVLIPAQLAFPSVNGVDAGRWGGLLRLADRLNLDYNLVPSLHVALSVVCVSCLAARARGAVKLLLYAWALAIAVSTVLTHQHHVIDVLGGGLLALAAVRMTSGPLTLERGRALRHNRSASVDPRCQIPD